MAILEHINGVRERTWDWFKVRAHGKHALWWLILLSVTEPIFSFIVPETLLVAILLAGSKRWRFYAFVTSVASAVGSIIGYVIGAYLFEVFGRALIAFYGLEGYFMKAQAIMEEHIFITMFSASFTPLPDKVFVLAAGFFGASFIPYLLGFVVGRTLRFYLVAYLVHRFGAKVLALIERYVWLVSALALAVLCILILWSLLF